MGRALGVVVSFPFAAINSLPQSILSDIILQDGPESGINREDIFFAAKTFIKQHTKTEEIPLWTLLPSPFRLWA